MNSRPRAYESPALPLSYPGTVKTERRITDREEKFNRFVRNPHLRAARRTRPHIHWVVDRFLPIQIGRRIAEQHGFRRVHAKRCGKWAGDYLAKYLSKEVRAACLNGKRLWAGFGKGTGCRVKDIEVQSWLGDEYCRLRGKSGKITRVQCYRLLQDALRRLVLD